MHTTPSASARSHRPRSYTVFGAAFVAGAAAAFGVNNVLDAHLARSRPQVESESILVAIRSLPAGAPVTVWDVALKDWPKAMVPAAAMRVTDDLENLVARHPLREGQPVLAVQLARVDAEEAAAAKPVEVVSTAHQGRAAPERDLWDPGQPVSPPRDTIASRPTARVEPAPESVTRTESAPTVPATPAPSVAITPPAVAPVVPAAPTTTPPAEIPAATAAATPAAPVETLTLPGGPATATPAGETAATTPAKPEAPAIAAAPTDPQPAATEPATVAHAPAATVSPTVEPSADLAATSRGGEQARGGTRPHPSSVQFLSVPAPESLEADSQPPLPDEGSTAWVGGPPTSPTADAATATASATAKRGSPKNAATARSARAPAPPQRQPQSQQPPGRKPQRGQRTADTRGYRPH